MRLLRSFGFAGLLCLLGTAPATLHAHALTITQVLVSFDRPGMVALKVDIDLTLQLGSIDAYYKLGIGDVAYQKQVINEVAPKVANGLQLFTGDARLAPILQDYVLPVASKSDYQDASISKFTTLNYLALLPPGRAPLRLVVPIGGQIEFPVAFTVQIPAAHISITRWMEAGSHESDPVAWAEHAPEVGAGSAVVATTPAAASAKPDVKAPASATTFDVDTLSWHEQLTMYLRLGFHHIVPEGADHILFVLGLFFLGVTWRKLLSQTTVFTVAHATTLFLSTYGVFRAPSRYVEPLIALSIAFIALENVWRPKLGMWRLVVVFGFGLIHGLGFASSLSEIPFPKHQFVVALLGFNFGVDFGQLFIIGLAFLAVGWFRNRPWFRARIAIPCSLAIAAVGLFWAVQRIIFYTTH